MGMCVVGCFSKNPSFRDFGDETLMMIYSDVFLFFFFFFNLAQTNERTARHTIKKKPKHTHTHALTEDFTIM